MLSVRREKERKKRRLVYDHFVRESIPCARLPQTDDNSAGFPAERHSYALTNRQL